MSNREVVEGEVGCQSRVQHQDDWHAYIDGFVHDNIRTIRLVSVWGPVLGVCALLSRSTPFRRFETVKSIPTKWFASQKRMRGRVLFPKQHTNANEGVFYFYHTPLLRNILWFDLQVVKPKHCIPMKLASLQAADRTQEERQLFEEKFWSILHEQDAHARLVHNKNDIAHVVLTERTIGIGRNLGEVLLRDGVVTLKKHDPTHLCQERLKLENKLPRIYKRYKAAETYARNHRRGVWDTRLPESNLLQVRRFTVKYLKEAFTSFFQWART